ncbi:MAG: sulfatase-like hydrolase/transferase [Bryobacterales bacterium]|nr:sulfatase-like hydrolase/transferase [Bryobacterales bacterium]MBV9396730.1 sulfatase-like hydrolase/transferase [Bryobacterales bacterium]
MSGLSRNLLSTAVYSCSAWIAFFAVELCFFIGPELFQNPDMTIMSWQWLAIVKLATAYASAGILLGAAARLFLWLVGLRDHGVAHYSFCAVVPLILVFSANLVRLWTLPESEYFALIIGAALAFAFAAALRWPPWKRVFLPFSGPFTVSLSLLIFPWIDRDIRGPNHSTWARIGLPLIVLITILAGASLKGRLRPGLASSPLAAAITASVVFGALASVSEIRGTSSNLPDSPSASSGQPNILLITLDTVRADHLSVYGYERDTTPNLREFARGATVYAHAVATSDFTLPAHASMFTGLYPAWHGARYSRTSKPGLQPLAPRHTTLAEVLRSHGYWTAESAANYAFLGPWTGLTKGFGVSDWTRPVQHGRSDDRFYLLPHVLDLPGINSTFFERNYRKATDITASGQKLLARAKANEKPFFLFLNYMDAHSPYVPGPPFENRFAENSAPAPSVARNERRLDILSYQVNSGRRTLRPREALFLMSHYDEGIAAEDAALGSLFEDLRRLGLFDNTMIVVTSDHGEGFVEHGVLGHRVGSVYETHLHVPLLIKYPKQQTAARNDLLVSQVDIMPTILDCAGIPMPVASPGRSVQRLNNMLAHPVFAESLGVERDTKFHGWRRAIFDDRMKLIDSPAGAPELYNLEADPDERNNLYTPGNPRAQQLLESLETWFASAPRESAKPKALDKSTLESLKSLGYVQ